MCALPARCVTILTTIFFLMLQAAFWAFPYPSSSADFDIPLKELKTSTGKTFDISLSDLKRAQKKSKKSSARRREEKKKTERAATEAAREATGPAEDYRTSASSTGGPATGLMPEPQPLQRQAKQEKAQGASSSVAGKAAPTADGTSILHDPYSYVVAGKRTVIYAVIVSAAEGLPSIYCLFRAADTGGFARVSMTRVEGTNYSYTAMLPSLSLGATSLRYMIMVTDTTGRKAHSKEFITPVKTTSVVPGWQPGPSPGNIKVWLEDPGKPLEGFSDVTIAGTDNH